MDIDAFGIVPRSPEIPTTLVVGHRGLLSVAADRTWVKSIRSYNQNYAGRLAPKPGQLSYQFHPTTPAIEQEFQRLIRDARHTDTFDI